MATDRDKLMRGVRFMAISFPFIFAGPALLYIGFNDDKSDWWLFFGGLCAALAVLFAVRGLLTIVSAFFDS
jgi:hypothetical protein